MAFSHKNLEIERLRAIAVLMTILVHTPFKQLFHPQLYSSFTGVDLFFVISGFVVTLSFLPSLPKEPPATAIARIESCKYAIIGFYLRRLFRIAPSAFFYIVLYWVAAILMKDSGSNADIARPGDIVREGVAFAAGIYNYASAAGAVPRNLWHYYSLSIEEHFYLLAPLLLVLCGRTSYRLVACAVGVGIVLFVARPMTSGSIATLSHTRFDELFDGVIVALLVEKYRPSSVWRAETLLAAAPAALVALMGRPWARAAFKTSVGLLLCAVLILLPGVLNTDILGGDSHAFYFSSAAFCGHALVSTMLVVLASLERGWIMQIPILAPVLEYVGSRSYSLYLGHVLLIEVYNDLYFRFYEHIPDFFKLTRPGYALQFALFLVIAMLLAELTYRFVETPFRRVGTTVVRSLREQAA